MLYLYIGSSAHTGTFPTWVTGLTELERLWIYNTDITGTIPSDLGDLSQLVGLGLYGNQLTGPIPAELGQLTGLHVLYLHGNQLSGSVPEDLGDLFRLTRFYISENKLTGDLPKELGNLTYLVDVRLAGNSFASTTCIPGALQNVADNDYSDAGLAFCVAPSKPARVATNAVDGSITLSWTDPSDQIGRPAIDRHDRCHPSVFPPARWCG